MHDTGTSILARAEILEQPEQVAEPIKDFTSTVDQLKDTEETIPTDDLNESEISETNNDALDINENVLSSVDSKNGTATLDGDLED